jgi:hypothetical protein
LPLTLRGKDMDIQKPDEFMSVYAVEKALNPEHTMMLRAFRQRDVEDVDALVKLSRGNREDIRVESDWAVLNELMVFYIRRWPDEWMEFRNTMPGIRQTRRAKGYSQSKEIKYIAAMPSRLMKLIKVIFPYQQFNKKFMYEFMRRTKAFQVGGVSN